MCEIRMLGKDPLNTEQAVSCCSQGTHCARQLHGAEVRAAKPAILAGQVLYRWGIGADQATISAGALGVTAGVLFARSHIALGIFMLGLSGILDAVDGTIAREFETATSLGGLDLTLDRIVESFC